MAFRKALVMITGVTTQVPNADELIVGAGIEAAAVGPLAIGGGGIATSVDVTPTLNANAGIDTQTPGVFVFGGSGNASGWNFTDAPILTDFGIDRATAGNLAIGAATATGVTVTPLLTATGGVDTTDVDDLSGGGTLSIGTTAASAVDIGKIGSTTTIKGDFQVDGTETITGISTFNDDAQFNGNVIFGDAVTDTVSFPFAKIVGNLPFQQGSSHIILVEQSTAAGAVGGSLTTLAGDGGDNAAAVAGAGGVAGLQGGDGGVGTGFAGGAGGNVSIAGGVGGAGTVQGVGGDVNIQAGAGVTSGNIDIGTTNAASIDIGNAVDNPTTTFLGSGTVTSNGLLVAAQSLRVSASGNAAYAEFDDGVSAAVSAATEGRLRYNDTTGTFQVSVQGGAYTDLAVGGAENLAATLAVGTITGGVAGSHTIEFSQDDNIAALSDGGVFQIAFAAPATAGIGGQFRAIGQIGAATFAGGASRLYGGNGGTDGAGGNSAVIGGDGGVASATAGGAGGNGSAAGGTGGAGTAGLAAGAGGAAQIRGGDAGADNGGGGAVGGDAVVFAGAGSTGVVNGQTGGGVVITGGTGGDGGTGTSGEGGLVAITGGDAGLAGGGGGNKGGDVAIQGGAGDGAGDGGDLRLDGGVDGGTGTEGAVEIGGQRASVINIGNVTGNPPVAIVGSGGLSMATDGFVRMDARVSAPSTGGTEGAVYTKDVGAGDIQLFYRTDSNGTEYQLTPTGGASSTAGKLVMSIDTTTNSMLTGQAAYIDSSGDADQADASTGSPAAARFAGFYQGTAGEIQIAGVADVTGRITGALTVGAPVYIDITTPGNVTATAPSAATEFVAEVGLAVTSTSVLIQPKAIIALT